MVRRSQDFTAQEIISSRLISRARRPLFIVGFPHVFVCFLNKYITIFWYHDVPIFNVCFIGHIWFKIKLEAWCWFSGDPCNFSQSYGIKYPIGRINGNFIINPTTEEVIFQHIFTIIFTLSLYLFLILHDFIYLQQCLSDINLSYACTREKTVMIDRSAWNQK